MLTMSGKKLGDDDSSLASFEYTDEMEIIMNQLMTTVDHHQPLKVTNFDCDEAIA